MTWKITPSGTHLAHTKVIMRHLRFIEYPADWKTVVSEWFSGSPSRPRRSSRGRNRRQSTIEASRDDESEDQDHSSDEDRGESDRDKGPSGFLRDKGGQILMHAALPLVAAGAAEALRARKEPGQWKGDKGKHVLTAAFTNGLMNKDPSTPHHHHIMDTTLRGLKDGAPTREERAAFQRRVGGSRTSSNLKKIAAAGAVAFVGKELYDRYGRSKSLARDYNDDRYRSKKLSHSISDDSQREMKSEDHEESDNERSVQSKDRDGQSNRDSRNQDYSSDGVSDSDMENDHHEDDSRRQQGSRDLAQPRSLNKYPDNHSRGAWPSSDYESDLGYSSDEKEKERKLKRDMMLTSGLATAASVHAAHRVYGSFNKRKRRTTRLEDGEITADEARRERIRANTIDAASLGLAALGITGAYGKWKEANERPETQSSKH